MCNTWRVMGPAKQRQANRGRRASLCGLLLACCAPFVGAVAFFITLMLELDTSLHARLTSDPRNLPRLRF